MRFVGENVLKGLYHSSDKSWILPSLDTVGKFGHDLEIARLFPFGVGVKEPENGSFVPVLLMRCYAYKVRESGKPIDYRGELRAVEFA